MKIDTPSVATHLLSNPNQYLTPIGGLLHKSSLDEFPQIISILKGDMSFVGPRPALFNQDDPIELRNQKGIHLLTPGLTGWAQVNGRDELPISVRHKDSLENIFKCFKKRERLTLTFCVRQPEFQITPWLFK